MENNKGFSLIETLIAVFLITMGTAGAFALIQQTITFTSASSARLRAAYLAQEGIEIVRNIRDTNYLAQEAWDSGLSGCASGCEADYNDTILSAYAGRALKINSGLYSYDSGTASFFKRRITVLPETNILNITSQVTWTERGKSYDVSAQTKLYNWR
jgi:prepilin-type N-terminal cleavage/methylation domain-containing protein